MTGSDDTGTSTIFSIIYLTRTGTSILFSTYLIYVIMVGTSTIFVFSIITSLILSLKTGLSFSATIY